MRAIEQWIEQDPRTYNSSQLAQKLTLERQIKLSARRIRHLLQKRGFVGSAPATRTEANKTPNRDNSNKLTSIP